MSELDDIRKRWDANYYSDMEIWDLAEELIRIATELEEEVNRLRQRLDTLQHGFTEDK